MARAPKGPSKQQQRFQLLLEQLLEEEGGDLHGNRSKVARRTGLAQPHVSMYLDGKRFAESRIVERVQAKLHIKPEFFTGEFARPPRYTQFVNGSARVEPELPESFRLWLESSLRPRDLTPEMERAMLATGFRFPPEDAHRWSTVFDLVRADRRATTDDTRAARVEAERVGLKRPRKRS